jgi:hypothetical protein
LNYGVIIYDKSGCYRHGHNISWANKSGRLLKNLTEGVCGIDYITKYDASDLKVRIAAEVRVSSPKIIWTPQASGKWICFLSTQCGGVGSNGGQRFEGKIQPDRLGVYIAAE